MDLIHSCITRLPFHLGALAWCLIVAASPVANAQCELERLAPFIAGAERAFGAACALDGESLLIGAPGSGSVDGIGDVTVFERTGFDRTGFERRGTSWRSVGSIVDPDADPGGRFGAAIDMDGNAAIIGASGVDVTTIDDVVLVDQGRATLAHRTRRGWMIEQTIDAAQFAPGQGFGAAVALDDTTMLIAAPNRGDGAVDVWRFVGGSWSYSTTITPTSPDVTSFGTALALDGDDMLIVGRQMNSGSTVVDAVVVTYRRRDTRWIEGESLLVEQVGVNSAFAPSIAVVDNLALIGAPADDHAGLWSGAVHVAQRRNGRWTIIDRLESPDAAAGDRFGAAVALDEADIVVAAPFGIVDDHVTGVMYRWSRSALGDAPLAITSMSTMGDEDIGQSIAFEGDVLIAGAPRSDVDAVNGGTAFVFATFVDCDCNGLRDEDEIAADPSIDCNDNGRPDVCDIADGLEQDCNGNGIPDACDIIVSASFDQNANGVPDECEAAPANDACAAGSLLVTDTPTLVSTINAGTNALIESCGGLTSDVWYRVVATCGTTLRISMCDANFDARVAVYTFPCPDADETAIACGDTDDAGALILDVPVPTPGLYRVRIGTAAESFGPPWGVATLTASCGPAPGCPGDCLRDGEVDIEDLTEVLESFGTSEPFCDVAPVYCDGSSGNGIINIDDLFTVLINFGPCPK